MGGGGEEAISHLIHHQLFPNIKEILSATRRVADQLSHPQWVLHVRKNGWRKKKKMPGYPSARTRPKEWQMNVLNSTNTGLRGITEFHSTAQIWHRQTEKRMSPTRLWEPGSASGKREKRRRRWCAELTSQHRQTSQSLALLLASTPAASISRLFWGGACLFGGFFFLRAFDWFLCFAVGCWFF